MKKIFKSLIFLTFIAFILYGSYTYVKNYNNVNNNESNNTGKDTTKEEYIYTDELLELGYSLKDIITIKNHFTEEEVSKYLLNKKYDNLIDYLSVSYFNIENIDRYDSYKEKHADYTLKQIIVYTEIGLDREFYTNIVEINNYDDELVLVNKYYKLPDNYSASGLKNLTLDYSNQKQKVKESIIDNIESMFDDAKKAGYKLKVISGYRTQSTQNTLFNNSKKNNGLTHALLYSAKPGHSEHQTGYAIDINTVQDSFVNTKEYAWLKENSYKYGFIERYPKGKEFITGYGFEPWHYRYVGLDVAAKIYVEDITLEEYYVEYLN